jgi:choline-sulfatase
MLFSQASLAKENLPARPNILYILTDQQAATMLSCSGNQYLKTPNLDKLSNSGVRFSRAYSTNPVSVPSRFSMMTGLMPSQVNGESNDMLYTGVSNNVLSGALGNVFKNSGYKTVYGGKVHLPGIDSEFDNVNLYGFKNISSDYKAKLAQTCADYIKQKHDSPFIMVASFMNPHDICYMAVNAWNEANNKPLYTGEAWKTLQEALKIPVGMSEETFFNTVCPPLPDNFEIPTDELSAAVGLNPPFMKYIRATWSEKDWRMHRWAYKNLTELVDKEIGVVLQALTDSGIENNTLVVFTSDHGDMDASHRLEHKALFYEESVKVPLIFKWPGRINPGVVDNDHLVMTGLDILPTLCDFAGISKPANLKGVSLKSITTGVTPIEKRDYIVSETENARMVFDKEWKYMVSGNLVKEEMLFNLKNDPGEMQNLAQKPEYITQLIRCKELMISWYKENNVLISSKYINNLVAETPAGSGTLSDPYKINTTLNLLAMRNMVNVASGSASSAAAAYYELSANIDMGDAEWIEPIGNATNRFKGSFNGNGFTISGLCLGTSGTPNSESSVIGLFGNIENASISNVKLQVNFNYSKSFAGGGMYTFGGLVSTIEGGKNTIDKCEVTGDIFAARGGTGNAFPLRLGGVVGGVNAGTVNIINCKSNVRLNASNTITTINNGSVYCGGIVGDAGNGSDLSIVNSYSLGSIIANSNNLNAYVGGIIGARPGSTGSLKVYNCYSGNVIETTGLVSANTAGILGFCWNLATLEIRNCVALNPRIYAYNTNTNTLTSPIVKRIIGIPSGSNVKLSDNYAYNGIDLKRWQGWNGIAGESIDLTPTNNLTGLDGAIITDSNASLLTKIKLNDYVAKNLLFAGNTLKYWTVENNFPEFYDGTNETSLVSNSDNKSLFSLNNGILTLKNIKESKRIRIYSAVGKLVLNELAQENYYISLRQGAYVLIIDGFPPQKIVVLK